MIIEISLYLFDVKTEGCAAMTQDHLPIGIEKHLGPLAKNTPPHPASHDCFPKCRFPEGGWFMFLSNIWEHDVPLSPEENSGKKTPMHLR